jgi:L-ascorbate metabolism protein UlaG (beta-lactamase superfamily)
MPLKITWLGHSAFQLSDGQHTVLIDPFISGNPATTTNADALSADAILLTHAHNDHVGDTVEIASRTGALVTATFELGSWLETQGLENVVPANHGGTVEFPGGSVKFVPAWHTSSYESDDGTVAPGVPAGLVIRFGGKTIYTAGDTCLFLDMQLIGEEELDIAILPIGDRFTMGPKDAARATKLLGAGTVIPCHYNTFPPIKQDPAQFSEMVSERSGAKVLILEPGETISLD